MGSNNMSTPAAIILCILMIFFIIALIALVVFLRVKYYSRHRICHHPQIQPVCVANIPLPNTLNRANTGQPVYSSQQTQLSYPTVPTMPAQNPGGQGAYPNLANQGGYPSNAPPQYSHGY